MAEDKVMIKEVETSSSFTFKNYVSSIKKYKWWVVGATALSAVIGYLGFKFVLNPIRSVFSGTYKYELAGKVEENGSYRLIDGTTFEYQDIVSKDVLDAVKNSKEEYKKIDVDKIYKSNAIVVERLLESSTSETSVDVSYKITAKTNAFPRGEIGKEFIKDLVNYPKQASTKAIENCSIISYIDDSTKNESFEKQIYALKNQYNAIVGSYKELSTDFTGMTSTGEEGQSISSAFNSFLSRYTDGSIDSVKVLEGKMYSDFYVNYVAGQETTKINEIKLLCESYATSKNSIDGEIKIKEDRLDALLGARPFEAASQDHVKEIMELNEKVIELKETSDRLVNQLHYYGFYYNEGTKKWEDQSGTHPCVLAYLDSAPLGWPERNTAFKNDLSNLLDSLSAERESATKVYKNVYSLHRNKVSMTGSGYISTDKHISSVVGAVGLAVVGFVVTTLITTAVYVSKKDKNED